MPQHPDGRHSKYEPDQPGIAAHEDLGRTWYWDGEAQAWDDDLMRATVITYQEFEQLTLSENFMDPDKVVTMRLKFKPFEADNPKDRVHALI